MSNDRFNDEVASWKRSQPTFLCSHCRKAVGVTLKEYLTWVKKTKEGVAITGKHVTGPDPIRRIPDEDEKSGFKDVQVWPAILDCKD